VTIQQQVSPMAVVPAVPSADPRVADATDNPLVLLHQYQQQLRAELLAAAADESAGSGAWWRRTRTPPAAVGGVGVAARAIQSQVAALTHAVSYFTSRQVVPVGHVAR
jgi:hypothetical protein